MPVFANAIIAHNYAIIEQMTSAGGEFGGRPQQTGADGQLVNRQACSKFHLIGPPGLQDSRSLFAGGRLPIQFSTLYRQLGKSFPTTVEIALLVQYFWPTELAQRIAAEWFFCGFRWRWKSVNEVAPQGEQHNDVAEDVLGQHQVPRQVEWSINNVVSQTIHSPNAACNHFGISASKSNDNLVASYGLPLTINI